MLTSALVDTRPLLDGSLPAEECARPGMHDFLEAQVELRGICERRSDVQCLPALRHCHLESDALALARDKARGIGHYRRRQELQDLLCRGSSANVFGASLVFCGNIADWTGIHHAAGSRRGPKTRGQAASVHLALIPPVVCVWPCRFH